MTRDEIREIASIVGDDKSYRHFVHRINKEFEISGEERNSKVYVRYVRNRDDENVGFAVIGFSPAKMAMWEKTFREEGWVKKGFSIDKDRAFELMYMYVRPEYRKKGYADAMFEDVVSFSEEQGAAGIYAYVSDTNDAALKFYLKKGAATIQDFSDDDTTTAFVHWPI